MPIEVSIQPGGSQQPHTVCHSNLRHVYWTLPQMIAHHTVGGCNLRPGDLLGTGTISSQVGLPALALCNLVIHVSHKNCLEV